MTVADVAAFLLREDRFILTAHETPDADALGSEKALLLGLRALGKKALSINADPASERCAFLDPEGDIENLTSPSFRGLPDNLAQWNLLVLDAEKGNIGNRLYETGICDKVGRLIMIDHHNREEIEEDHLIYPLCSSTCEIIYLLLKELKQELSSSISTALYAGIFYDTGSFIYPKTGSRTLRIAAELVENGVVPYEIFTHLQGNKSSASLTLHGLVMGTLSFHYNSRVATQYMPLSMLKVSRANYEEAQEFVNKPLQCKDVVISFFFKEKTSRDLRCSLRSKGEAKIDCSTIAARFGGGGHKTAAGFLCPHPYEKMKQKVLSLLGGFFD